MTPGEAPRETVRLLVDLDIEKPSPIERLPDELLPSPAPGHPKERRTNTSFDADIARILSETGAPVSTGDLARMIGRERKDLSRRLPACFVEIGKGSWWSPDRALPTGIDEVVTLPRNVGERVRAEASISSGGSAGFVRRRP